MEDTVAQPAQNDNNGILKTSAITVLLKYLSNFWKSLQMPLFNSKVELNFK